MRVNDFNIGLNHQLKPYLCDLAERLHTPNRNY
jgi:hypothetical protein